MDYRLLFSFEKLHNHLVAHEKYFKRVGLASKISFQFKLAPYAVKFSQKPLIIVMMSDFRPNVL